MDSQGHRDDIKGEREIERERMKERQWEDMYYETGECVWEIRRVCLGQTGECDVGKDGVKLKGFTVTYFTTCLKW